MECLTCGSEILDVKLRHTVYKTQKSRIITLKTAQIQIVSFFEHFVLLFFALYIRRFFAFKFVVNFSLVCQSFYQVIELLIAHPFLKFLPLTYSSNLKTRLKGCIFEKNCMFLA